VRIFRKRFGAQGAEQARSAMWKGSGKKKVAGGDAAAAAGAVDEDTSLTFTDFLRWDRKIFREQVAAAPGQPRIGRTAQVKLPPIGSPISLATSPPGSRAFRKQSKQMSS
jgi:hypothetical protein